jgi:glycosyltransferase involved in cell wall biosynthesis
MTNDLNALVKKRILVIDHTSPELTRDAGSYAAIQEMRLMCELGYALTFMPSDLVFTPIHTGLLSEMGVECVHSPFWASTNQFIQEKIAEFDAVYVTRFYVVESVFEQIKSVKPSIPIIFNNSDLHFLRELRLVQNSDAPEKTQEAMQIKERELKVVEEVDAVLCYTSIEHTVLSSHVPSVQNYQITPWVLPQRSVSHMFDERHGIAFLGYFGHQPNVEAFRFLIEGIMPALVKVRPDIVLHVYGSGMPDEFFAYSSSNVNMVGFVEDLADVYCHHRAFLVPLLSGAGIKSKVLDAFSYGQPSVLTDVAAEGTGAINGVNALLARSVDQWVDQIQRLHDDRELWREISRESTELARMKYGVEAGLRRFREIFASVGLEQ